MNQCLLQIFTIFLSRFALDESLLDLENHRRKELENLRIEIGNLHCSFEIFFSLRDWEFHIQ